MESLSKGQTRVCRRDKQLDTKIVKKKKKQQPKTTNSFLTQQGNPATRGGLPLAPKQKCVLLHIY